MKLPIIVEFSSKNEFDRFRKIPFVNDHFDILNVWGTENVENHLFIRLWINESYGGYEWAHAKRGYYDNYHPEIPIVNASNFWRPLFVEVNYD